MKEKNIIIPEEAAQYPPMGWNSWDCYGTGVTEEEVRGNAEYMAKYMRPFGWEYIVVDIQWYARNAVGFNYNAFSPIEMDGYSRAVPAVNRFPSAVNGAGFKPLADYIHSLGLKFGIHIMRGIPRQAVHANTPILGTDIRAREIAHLYSICTWNTDMYGVDPAKEGAQQYYQSLVDLYASWGVDYIKADDMSNTCFLPDCPYSAAGEIELLSTAIRRCGRKIVLSVSPGPSPLGQAEHLRRHVDMWRMTADFWDRWDDLLAAFEFCRQWTGYGGSGHWPDCDMLPFGHLGIRSPEDRWTRFTKDEQVTLMTLWSIFRSPLMMGGEMRDNDEWTLSLLTNSEVLRLLKHSHSARELFRNGYLGQHIAWAARDDDGGYYLAMFNTWLMDSNMEVQFSQIGIEGTYKVRDLWKREDIGTENMSIRAKVPFHGARLFKLTAREEK